MEGCKKTYIHNNPPKCTKFFKEVQYTDILSISCNKPNIDSIISAILSPELVDVRLVSTEIGRSNEGQNLAGHKLIITVNLREKLTYISNEVIKSAQTVYFNTVKNFYVVLPKVYNGETVCDLIRLNRYSVDFYVENVSTRVLDKRDIFQCVLLYIGINLF